MLTFLALLSLVLLVVFVGVPVALIGDLGPGVFGAIIALFAALFAIVVVVAVLGFVGTLLAFVAKLVFGLVGIVFSLVGGVLAFGVVLGLALLAVVPLAVPVLVIGGLIWLIARAQRPAAVSPPALPPALPPPSPEPMPA